MNAKYAIRCTGLAAVLLCVCAWGEMGLHWWPCGTAPWSPRKSHTVVVADDTLWLIGGEDTLIREYDGISEPRALGDVWNSENGISWTKIGETLPLGLLRNPQGIVIDNTMPIYLFATTYLSDKRYMLKSMDGIVWEFHEQEKPYYVTTRTPTVAHKGKLRQYYQYSSELPPEMWESADGIEWERRILSADMPFNPGSMYSFWGELFLFTLFSGIHEVWQSDDGIEWTLMPAADENPEGLSSRHIIEMHDKLWMLNSKVFSSSDGIDWHLVTNAKDPVLDKRYYYGAVAWKNRIWVFGGGSGYRGLELNDIWYTEETPAEVHRADYDSDGVVSLSELLRAIQFYHAGKYQCDGRTEDSYAPGAGYETCVPHSSDYAPQDWTISLRELLRLIQFYNSDGYSYCPDAEDGFCPGQE